MNKYCKTKENGLTLDKTEKPMEHKNIKPHMFLNGSKNNENYRSKINGLHTHKKNYEQKRKIRIHNSLTKETKREQKIRNANIQK